MFILVLESTTVGTLTWFAGLSPARMPAVTSQQCVSKYIESHSKTQPSNFISRSRKSLRFLPWKRAFFITKLHCCQCCVILLFFQCHCFYLPLIIIKIKIYIFLQSNIHDLNVTALACLSQCPQMYSKAATKLNI